MSDADPKLSEEEIGWLAHLAQGRRIQGDKNNARVWYAFSPDWEGTRIVPDAVLVRLNSLGYLGGRKKGHDRWIEMTKIGKAALEAAGWTPPPF